MTFPVDIYEQREVENLPGLEYDKDNKKTLFAEDILGFGQEITAIEETLGQTVAGSYDTVAERLDNMSGGGSFIYEKKVLATATNSLIFDTPISMDSLTFLKVQYIVPGRLSNSSLRFLINNDTTTTNYPRTRFTVGASTAAVDTADTSNLNGLSSTTDTNDYTISWVFELRKLPNKYLHVFGYNSVNGASIKSAWRQINFNYQGSLSDITDIRFVIDSGNFPVGTTFIMSEF